MCVHRYVYVMTLYFRYKNDLWLWDLDWSVQDVRIKKMKPPKKGRKGRLPAEQEVRPSNGKV